MRDGWLEAPLGRVFRTMTGTTPPKANEVLYGDFLPFVKPPELLGGPVSSAKDGLSRQGARQARIAPKGTVLVSCIGNLGKVGLVESDVAFNQQINALLPSPEHAVSKFMFYQCLSSRFRAQLESLATGTTIRMVNKSNFNSIEVILPPLSEQRRIAAVLDDAFDGIAKAQMLANQNLLRVSSIIDSWLAATFEQVARDSDSKRLGDATDRLTNGYVGPTRDIYMESGVPYLLAKHVKKNRLQFDGQTHVSEEFNRRNGKSTLKTGDVLLVQSGHIGHSAVVPAEHAGHNCHAMIVMSPREDQLDGAFLSWYFGSPQMQEVFQSMRTGSTIKHLNCRDVREMRVPLPSLARQRKIAVSAEELSVEVRGCMAKYRARIDDLGELKASLLDCALSGQL